VAQIDTSSREDRTDKLPHELSVLPDAERPQLLPSWHDVDVDPRPRADVLALDPANGVRVEGSQRELQPELAIDSTVQQEAPPIPERQRIRISVNLYEEDCRRVRDAVVEIEAGKRMNVSNPFAGMGWAFTEYQQRAICQVVDLKGCVIMSGIVGDAPAFVERTTRDNPVEAHEPGSVRFADSHVCRIDHPEPPVSACSMIFAHRRIERPPAGWVECADGQ
jgi:hypothetical protein